MRRLFRRLVRVQPRALHQRRSTGILPVGISGILPDVSALNALDNNYRARCPVYPQARRLCYVSLLALGFFFAALVRLNAAEVIPPKPDRYFNDYAHIVSASAAQRLNEQLAQFERDTSNQ